MGGGEPFLVLRDPGEVVEVVDHQAHRLALALFRQVRPGMDLVQQGAVAEVEAGNGIKRQPVRVLGRDEVMRGKRAHGLIVGRIVI